MSKEDAYLYDAFGCSVRSAHPIVGLSTCEVGTAKSGPNIRLQWEGAELAPQDFDLPDAGLHVLSSRRRRLLISGIASLELHLIDDHNVEIGARGPLQDVHHFLLRRGLSIALSMLGRLWFSASAVVVGDHALVIMGPAAIGKSAIAAALVASGEMLLSDHGTAIVIQDRSVSVCRGTSVLQLWPDACVALGQPERLGEARAGLGKWRVAAATAAKRCWPLGGFLVPCVGHLEAADFQLVTGCRKFGVIAANANDCGPLAAARLMAIAQSAPMWTIGRAPVPSARFFLDDMAALVKKAIAHGG